MIHNPIIDAMMQRKSVRKYKEDMPSDEVVETIVRAGQQAPFAYQLCSVLLSRNRKKNYFHAPLLFTICVDSHRMEVMMAKRNWKMVNNDLSLLLFGLQDASYQAENMVMAAESLGLGSCFLGATPYRADKIIEKYKLPKRVFPMVELTMGYPAEDNPPRPRYPLDFSLFEDEYPQFNDETVEKAMKIMDKGYMAQGYYRKAKLMIPLQGGREETFTFDTYGWTEHISRKAGQWLVDPQELLGQMEKCGFVMPCIAANDNNS
jgi:FMN reductase (NADPH)